MLLGKPYGDVVTVVRDMVPEEIRRRVGMRIQDVIDVARVFGADLRKLHRSKGYLNGRTGILGVIGGGMDKAGHWVLVKNEVIADPDDGTLWSVEDYKRRHKCRTTVLLVRED